MKNKIKAVMLLAPVEICCTLLAILAITMVTVAIVQRVAYPSEVQRVEMIRENVCVVDGDQRKAVLDRALNWNEKIVSCQYWRNYWYSKWAFASCEELELIDITCHNTD
jgi:hypothetical protein